MLMKMKVAIEVVNCLKNYNLINARKKKGLTQEDVASEVGVSKSTVSNWENHYSVPPMKRAFKVANLLDSDVNHLFYSKNSK